MSIHSVSLKGKRESNEDKHTIRLYLDNPDNADNKYAKVNFYGVYDGHGGKFVSKYLHDNLHTFFVDKRVKYPLTKSYVNKAYDCIQKNLEDKHGDQSLSCGSTSLCVIHFEENNSSYLNIMNTGDCRAILCRNNIGYPLTKDHKPGKPEERHRIGQLGGKIYFDGYDWRINDLSVSRAFGDNESKAYVTHRPDLYKYKITKKDKFMVIACDGLWDVMTSQDVVDYILENFYDMDTEKKTNKRINVAKKLGEYAIEKKGSTDNITAMVVFFQN
jgi:serine/threonine protein phosphatase PrpC